MAEFDPYYIWLGIPPDEQPPDYYRLLGIRKFESNPDVIANAAEQRVVHVRSMQGGLRQGESQPLLNEIFLAMRVLLDQEKKSRYDSQLEARLNQVALTVEVAQVPPSVYTTTISSPAAPVSVAAPPVSTRGAPIVVASNESQSAPRRPPPRQRGPLLIPGWMLGLVLAAIALPICFFFMGMFGPRKNETSLPEQQTRKQQSRAAEVPIEKAVKDVSPEQKLIRPGADVKIAIDTPPERKPDRLVANVPAKVINQPATIAAASAETPPDDNADPLPETSESDEILRSVTAAKQKWVESLKDAEESLLNTFDGAIVAAAKAKDANVVEALMEQKERFLDASEPPTATEIAAGFKEYVTSRTQLDSELNRVYKNATLAYAEKLMMAESKAIAEEGKAFVAAEKAELGRLCRDENSIVVKPEGTPSVPFGTPHFVDVFLKAYEKEIEKADSQETSARFEQVMKDLPPKMDVILKAMTWTIRCPIVEVKEDNTPGTYAIHFEMPDELSAFQAVPQGDEEWRIRSKVNMKLKKEDALSVAPGQLLVITAIPRFPAKPTSREEYVFLQRFLFKEGERRNHFQHYIEFSKVKMDIRPAPIATRKAE